MNRAKLLTCCVVCLLARPAFGAGAYISGVPDWNQPKSPDNNLGIGQQGPVNTVNSPVNGSAAAWCVPAASADIMGYYKGLYPGLTIADGLGFSNTSALPASDWRDGMLDTLTAAPNNRADIGWYMNTNDIGNPALLSHNDGHTGTKYSDILPGLAGYFGAHNVNATLVNFAIPGLNAIDNSGAAGPHDVPAAYLRIKTQVNAGRPLLLHLAYWSLQNRVTVPNDPQAPVSHYDWAQWGAQVFNDPVTGEVYQTGDLGHTVVLVGYIDGGVGLVAGNPFSGQMNGNTPDAVIVLDNNDGTYAGPADLPLILPFSAVGGALFTPPWDMQTEISNVPEPATLAVLALGGVGAVAARRRRIGR